MNSLRFLGGAILWWLLLVGGLSAWYGSVEVVLHNQDPPLAHQLYLYGLYIGLLGYAIGWLVYLNYRLTSLSEDRQISLMGELAPTHLLAVSLGLGLLSFSLGWGIFVNTPYLVREELLWYIPWVSGLVVALIEELFFRGIILRVFLSDMGWKKALLLHSFLFALVHLFRNGSWEMKLLYGCSLFLLSLLLGTLLYKGYGLLSCITLHGAWVSARIHFDWVSMNLTPYQEWIYGRDYDPVSGVVVIGVLALMAAGGIFWLPSYRSSTS